MMGLSKKRGVTVPDSWNEKTAGRGRPGSPTGRDEVLRRR